MRIIFYRLSRRTSGAGISLRGVSAREVYRSFGLADDRVNDVSRVRGAPVAVIT